MAGSNFEAELAAAQQRGLARKQAEQIGKESAKPLVARDNDTTLEALEAGVYGAGAGLLGAATAVPQLGLAAAESAASALGASGTAESLRSAREALGGRQLLDSAASVAHRIALPDDEVEGAMQEWRARSRRLAGQYSGATTAGELGGGLFGIAAGGPLGVSSAGAAAAKGASALGAGRLVAGAAQGVAEGAALGAASAQGEAYIAERQLTGEQVLASAGVSGLLGGGLNFGLLAAGSLAGKASGAAQKLLGRVGTEGNISRAVSESTDRAIVKAAEGTLGEEIGAEVPAYTRELAAGKEVRPRIVSEATSSLQSDLDTMMRRQDELVDVVTRAKESNVAAGFAKEAPPEGAIEKAREVAATVREELLRTRQEMAASVRESSLAGGMSPKAAERAVASVQTRMAASNVELEAMFRRVDGAETASEAYDALDRARRHILKEVGTDVGQNLKSGIGGDIKKISQNSPLGNQVKQAYQDQYRTLYNHLFDESTWGRQGAVQREVNEAWSGYIDAKKYAFGDIATPSGTRYLDDVGAKLTQYRIEEGKLEGVVGAFGTSAGRDKLASLMQYVESTEKLGAAIGRGYGHNEAAAKAGKELTDAALRIRRTIGEVAERTTSLRQAESLIHGTEDHATGVVGTMAVASGITGQAPQAMLRLKLEQAATRVAKKIVTGVNWIGETAAPTAGRAGRDVSRGVRAAGPTAMARLVGKYDSPQDALSAMAEKLDRARAQNGEGVRASIQQHMGSVADVDPHATGALAAAATRGVELLRAALPNTELPSSTPLTERKRAQSGRAETMAFADLVEAVDHPVDVLSRIGQGTVSSAQINAIRQVYPELYEFTRSAAIQKIRKLDAAGKTVPFRQRASVDMLLGLDGAGERILGADFALSLGPMLTAPPQGVTPPQGAGGEDHETPKSGTDEMLGATG